MMMQRDFCIARKQDAFLQMVVMHKVPLGSEIKLHSANEMLAAITAHSRSCTCRCKVAMWLTWGVISPGDLFRPIPRELQDRGQICVRW